VAVHRGEMIETVRVECWFGRESVETRGCCVRLNELPVMHHTANSLSHSLSPEPCGTKFRMGNARTVSGRFIAHFAKTIEEVSCSVRRGKALMDFQQGRPCIDVRPTGGESYLEKKGDQNFNGLRTTDGFSNRKPVRRGCAASMVS